MYIVKWIGFEQYYSVDVLYYAGDDDWSEKKKDAHSFPSKKSAKNFISLVSPNYEGYYDEGYYTTERTLKNCP